MNLRQEFLSALNSARLVGKANKYRLHMLHQVVVGSDNLKVSSEAHAYIKALTGEEQVNGECLVLDGSMFADKTFSSDSLEKSLATCKGGVVIVDNIYDAKHNTPMLANAISRTMTDAVFILTGTAHAMAEFLRKHPGLKQKLHQPVRIEKDRPQMTLPLQLVP